MRRSLPRARQRFLRLVSQRYRPLQGIVTLGNVSCDLSHNGDARQVARKIVAHDIKTSVQAGELALQPEDYSSEVVKKRPSL